MSETVRLALSLDDEPLRRRLAALLDGVPGLELVEAGRADAVVEAPRRRPPNGEDGAGGLSPREQEVLSLLAEGASNKEIARRLGISVHTAKFHVGSVIDKLDATGRTDAVAHAARIGVLHL